MSDKPGSSRASTAAITAKREAAIPKRLRERWESLLAVDEAVEKIIDELRDTGELDNTYVIFTSDHGFMQGEHRIPQGKMVPYDPSTQVPLLIRGPGIPRGRPHEGARGRRRPRARRSWTPRPPSAAHRSTAARSFRSPATRGCRSLGRCSTRPPARARRAAPTRARAAPRGRSRACPAWSAVRTTRWLYIEYRGGQRELYNLKTRPAGR